MPKAKKRQQEQLPPEKDLSPDDVDVYMNDDAVKEETVINHDDNKRTFVKVNENMSIKR
jgi:hypothetical protein